jgi:hypothetical protein
MKENNDKDYIVDMGNVLILNLFKKINVDYDREAKEYHYHEIKCQLKTPDGIEYYIVPIPKHLYDLLYSGSMREKNWIELCEINEKHIKLVKRLAGTKRECNVEFLNK